MKILELKKPEDIAKELDEEIAEVGGDFASKIEAKLKKYGYNPSDLEIRRKVLEDFFDRRRRL